MFKLEKLAIPLAVVTKNSRIILTEVQPWFAYENGKIDKNSLLGTKYTVVETSNYEKFVVKVSAPAIVTEEQIESSKEPIFVTFKDCFAKPYRNGNGLYDLSFTASTVIIEK